MLKKQKLIEYWESSKIIHDKKLFQAFNRIKREDFVLSEYRPEAYDDKPLPILNNQTISQPTTVMIMVQALELQKADIVLEIGAGSGYNAAIMSNLCKKVYSTEIIPELAEFARANLNKANIKNVEVICCDGGLGYKKKQQFDAIILTASAPYIPQELIRQLKIGGRIVAPIGPLYSQEMIKIIKKDSGLTKESLGWFRFVPLQGKHSYRIN